MARCVDEKNRPDQNRQRRAWETSCSPFSKRDLSSRDMSLDHCLVRLLVEQTVELGPIGNLDFEEPASTHRIAIHERRLIDDRLIDFGDFAAHWRINVRGGLDGFD